MADRDGVTLYLFNHGHKKYSNITSPQKVQEIFRSQRPSGSTNLAGVLKVAFQEHFSGNKPTTSNQKKKNSTFFFFLNIFLLTKKNNLVLVITDGSPDSEIQVINEIQGASNKLRRDEDLSVTFIQIGNDRAASRFLKKLDDDLKCRFDIVDTVSCDQFNGMSFEQLIEKSIND